MGLIASVGATAMGASKVPGLVGGLAGKVNGAVQNGVDTGQAQDNINPYLQQQTTLANQLQGVANGTGPNPALAQLNQTTQADGQQAASLLASQRGLNPGLAARTAAQQQTQANQTAAGEAATLSAQQQLGAMGQLNNVYGSQANETNTASKTAADIGAGNQQQTGKLIGGAFQGAGVAAGLMAEGGVVQPAAPINAFATIPAQGPQVGSPIPAAAPPTPADGPQSNVGKALKSGSSDDSDTSNSGSQILGNIAKGMMASGGQVRQVQTILSPGERTLTPQKAQAVAAGKADPIKASSKVPGKAKVAGDSYANDVVPKKQAEGSIVIPRSIAQGPNPHWNAKKFVEAHLGLKPKRKK